MFFPATEPPAILLFVTMQSMFYRVCSLMLFKTFTESLRPEVFWKSGTNSEHRPLLIDSP